MDDKKKQMNQVIILVVLLGVLGFMMFRMFGSMSGSSSQQNQARNATEEAATPGTPQVTAMGTVVTGGPIAESDMVAELGLIGPLNTNVFKVHGISSARNPFNRDASWYSDEVEKIPGRGLPENFVNEMSDEVPDLNALFGIEDEIVAYTMEKKMLEDSYSFDAVSEDGKITTNIQARTKTDPAIRVEYTEAKGREVEEKLQTGASEDGQTGLPFGASPFSGTQFEQGPAPGATRAPRTTDDENTAYITCFGISIKGDERSALISLPDGVRLVQEGDVLMPGNIKVVRISENGIEIRDIRTGEQALIPLSTRT